MAKNSSIENSTTRLPFAITVGSNLNSTMCSPFGTRQSSQNIVRSVMRLQFPIDISIPSFFVINFRKNGELIS